MRCAFVRKHSGGFCPSVLLPIRTVACSLGFYRGLAAQTGFAPWNYLRDAACPSPGFTADHHVQPCVAQPITWFCAVRIHNANPTHGLLCAKVAPRMRGKHAFNAILPAIPPALPAQMSRQKRTGSLHITMLHKGARSKPQTMNSLECPWGTCGATNMQRTCRCAARKG